MLWYVSLKIQLKNGLRLLKSDRDIIRFIHEFSGEKVMSFIWKP